MITISKRNDNEISLNFTSIYLILYIKLYNFLECYVSRDLKMV